MNNRQKKIDGLCERRHKYERSEHSEWAVSKWWRIIEEFKKKSAGWGHEDNDDAF